VSSLFIDAHARSTTLTTFLELNLTAPSSSPSGARTSRSRLPRPLSYALVEKSPQTSTSTQLDVRISCLARPGPRRTDFFMFLRVHSVRQGVATTRGYRLLRAHSRPLLAGQLLHSRRSRAAHWRTAPPRRPHPRLRSLRPRLRLQ
jgi:hypothetical protein